MCQLWLRLGPLVTFVMNRSCMLTLLRIGNNRLGVDWRYWVWITLRVYGGSMNSQHYLVKWESQQGIKIY